MIISKRYRLTKDYKLCVIATIDGRAVSFEFGGADRYQGVHGSYTTRNKKEQEYLENSPMFNRDYVLERQRVIESPKKANEPEKVVLDLEPMKFASVKKAQEFLEGKGCADSWKYNTQAKAIEKCREYGVEASFEK